jgi:hypothetical protein
LPDVCGHEMYSYDHWSCQRPKHSIFTAHRFNNYVAARVPRFWEVRQLLRVYQWNHMDRSIPDKPAKRRYVEVLFPDRYDPV